MEGPRGARPGDLPSLRELTDLVMREGLVDQFAQLFNADNYENLRICADNGRCVCHVGMTERDAVLFGCPIGVACIGGVCTHPEYRKRGLASACFDDALRKAREDGVDIMIVSGDRNLYRMRGCVRVGSDLDFVITESADPATARATKTGVAVDSDLDALRPGRSSKSPAPAGAAVDKDMDEPRRRWVGKPLAAPTGGPFDSGPNESHTGNAREWASTPNDGLSVGIMTEGELPLVMECYRNEPVRFLRPPDDYRYALTSGWVMNRPSDFLVIREHGAFRGYVIAPREGKDGSASAAEYAGERRAILQALPLIRKRYDLSALRIHVQRHDTLMQSLCEQAGLVGSPRATPGTVTLVNFTQFMKRMRARFAEILGTKLASQLRFDTDGDRCVFRLERTELELDRSEAARLLFGAIEGLSTRERELQGELGDALRAVLPLPTLWYGINYV